MEHPSTIAALRQSEYRVLPVKAEMRKNLIKKIKAGEPLFPGIIGYDASVIPQLENAILSGQDIVFLGERGQAKSRIIRSLVHLLDEQVPIIDGCEINDSPYAPICRACRDRVAADGDRVAVRWIGPDERYSEKLATPDTSIADLIGEVDPIRIAEGKYLADELTIHFGLVPRTNRGIFAINELPDLAERIQVGLLNLIEERDVQIRGFKLRLPIDVVVVASANPEDYTNRGRIITPLKDRFGAQIRTHYPRTFEDEIRIVDQERTDFQDRELPVFMPDFMKEIVAEITQLARRSPKINQRSGVSVRISISNYENLASNASRRALRTGETEAVPRISDLPSVIPSSAGKLEMETWEEGDDQTVLEKIIKTAVLNVFRRHFEANQFTELVQRFDAGLTFEVSEGQPADRYSAMLRELPGMEKALKSLGLEKRPALAASGMEFVLEGLHLSKRINKTDLDGASIYAG
ncbi:MAG: magnesium chelatase [Candidatus Dormibacteraeota bacterium]|nr:magnesium chelatase [Candidatus Dormibacteraeota bacterium]